MPHACANRIACDVELSQQGAIIASCTWPMVQGPGSSMLHHPANRHPLDPPAGPAPSEGKRTCTCCRPSCSCRPLLMHNCSTYSKHPEPVPCLGGPAIASTVLAAHPPHHHHFMQRRKMSLAGTQRGAQQCQNRMQLARWLQQQSHPSSSRQVNAAAPPGLQGAAQARGCLLLHRPSGALQLEPSG